MIRRIYVEKKPGFDIEAQRLYKDLYENLGVTGLIKARIINRYDVAGITEEIYTRARNTIFSEPPVDIVYDEEMPVRDNEHVFAIEYLPGQYDQRADWAAQCIQILTQQDRPDVASAKVILLEGDLSKTEIDKIKDYLINPVEAREASLDKPDRLDSDFPAPADVKVIMGFIDMTGQELEVLATDLGLAMHREDIEFCQAYFKETERRNPTITEIKAIDTYWSDHCRHTTFLTEIQEVTFEGGPYSEPIEAAYAEYIKSRERVYLGKQKAVSLMDIATLAMKEARMDGRLEDLDVSDEINACSIIVNVDIDGDTEEWLVMFKNETHNHPTEIEPFGGAATCLGGAIRDPLSGRAYVYQAMRVTGSGDPRTSVADTLPGKLPQRIITTGAAAGYSSYGNQIGLATGQVAEVYDPGFVAKRMEIGAVIAAAPRKNVIRKAPVAGDVIILVGGRTGRDGIGGATGSSKEHTEESLATCGAEVQKGNPPTERKIQRLFRHPEASRVIKRCNDFGAGGVSVAIGELTDGVEIDLDAVPKKYEGLDGTELAISESQERMAVVVAAQDAFSFIEFAAAENLEATVVAKVTDNRRLRMLWRGQTIVDISRDFLDTSGCQQYTRATIEAPSGQESYFKQLLPQVEATLADTEAAWLANLRDLNVCSQKGLVERFDSTIGSGSVLLPFGGKRQETPVEGMVAKIPVLSGETHTATIMTYGYHPQLASWSPFHGGLYAVIEAVAKVIALGGDYTTVRLTLQEYFEKLGKDERKWGKPLSALLGAYYAQKCLGTPAIGGKDSMSGTFKDLHVPPTLVAFAVAPADTRNIISPEFKSSNSRVVLVPINRDNIEMPDFEQVKCTFAQLSELVRSGTVRAASVVKTGGIAAAVSKMCFGNDIGFEFAGNWKLAELFLPNHGSIILEIEDRADGNDKMSGIQCMELGRTISIPEIRVNGSNINLEGARKAWEEPLEPIFPSRTKQIDNQPYEHLYTAGSPYLRSAISVAKPRVFIPVFPGTNCEYDSARAFEKEGGTPQILVLRNLTARDIENSVDAIVRHIENAQIIMLPGGFSAGDEPDGSGKFIATVFRNPKIKEAVSCFLKKRDGLMLGICNGFQALIKLGLLPYGEIRDMEAESPTLTYNVIGRHASTMVMTKVVSNLSPWLSGVQVGDIHSVPVSHGEGRFIANTEQLQDFFAKGQVATQYVGFNGKPSYDIHFNPNGSAQAIEGLTSPDGRILGKMAHSERIGRNVALNVPGEKNQCIFASGIQYFK